MEDNLKDFFLIVANLPLPDHTKKYIEAMENVPIKRPDDYVSWLRYRFERRMGRTKIKGFLYPMFERKVYDPFSDKDFKSFVSQREILIHVLNEIVEGKDFFHMKYLSKINGFANSLQSMEVFEVFAEPDKCGIRKATYQPKITDDTPELEGIFALACYGLMSFLADTKGGGRDRINKCTQCGNFFLWKRKDVRNRFCSDDCRHLHYSIQRKTDNGRAERAKYMVEHRKVLKNRQKKSKKRE